MTVAVKKYWSLERCGFRLKPNKKQFVLKLDLSVSGQPLTERSQLSGIFSPPLFSQCRSEIAVSRGIIVSDLSLTIKFVFETNLFGSNQTRSVPPAYFA